MTKETEMGIIVLGHGSRAEKAREVFNELVDKLADKLADKRVGGAAMELASPTLPEKVSHFASQGIKKIVILPLFLYPGIHVQEDIPAQIAALEEEYPEIEFILADILGTDDKLVDIMIEKFEEVK